MPRHDWVISSPLKAIVVIAVSRIIPSGSAAKVKRVCEP